MTKKRERLLVQKFLSWLAKKKCLVSIDIVGCRRSKMKTCTVTQIVKGVPANTICYETFNAKTPDAECWAEILRRRCGGRLLFDRFEIFGLGNADSLEELELKLEIADS